MPALINCSELPCRAAEATAASLNSWYAEAKVPPQPAPTVVLVAITPASDHV
ncbi:MAG: hypothetical protein ACK595_02615 [Planctomycetota bacterium]